MKKQQLDWEKLTRMHEEYRNAEERKDYQTAFSIIKEAADMGDPIMQYNCGVYYLKGWGTDIDEVKALDWFAEAAESEFDDNEDAAYAITNAAHLAARMCYNGQGCDEKDYESAIDYYRIAALRDHLPSMYCLACMYANGQGTYDNKSHLLLSIFFLNKAKKGALRKQMNYW
jgi:TPR repeat protein